LTPVGFNKFFGDVEVIQIQLHRILSVEGGTLRHNLNVLEDGTGHHLIDPEDESRIQDRNDSHQRANQERGD
jgi:hypothetical protein